MATESEHNLSVEFEFRAEQAYKKKNPECTGFRIERDGTWRPSGTKPPALPYPASRGGQPCGTWTKGFVFDATYRKRVVNNGITFKVIDLKVDDPVGDDDMTEETEVLTRVYINTGETKETGHVALSRTTTRTSSVQLSFAQTFSTKVGAEASVAVQGVGSVGASIEIGFEVKAGQQFVNKFEHSFTEKDDFDISVPARTRKTVTIVRKRGGKTVPFQMTIQAQGYFFHWNQWKGGSRWSGWPADRDYDNPLCNPASEFEGTREPWVVKGEMTRVRYNTTVTTAYTEEPIPDGEEVISGVTEVDLLAQSSST